MMRSRLALLSRPATLLLGALTLAGCPSDPGELQPLFDAIEGLPGYDHPQSATLDQPPVDGWPRFEMGVRNVGDSVVIISGATLTEDGERFSDPALDITEVEPEGQAVVSFRYITPGGIGGEGTLTISSDASNAELTIPVSVADYVAPTPMDGGMGGDGDGDGDGDVDAGDGDGDGDTDAGDGDGDGDAGLVDSGAGTTDAGDGTGDGDAGG